MSTAFSSKKKKIVLKQHACYSVFHFPFYSFQTNFLFNCNFSGLATLGDLFCSAELIVSANFVEFLGLPTSAWIWHLNLAEENLT